MHVPLSVFRDVTEAARAALAGAATSNQTRMLNDYAPTWREVLGALHVEHLAKMQAHRKGRPPGGTPARRAWEDERAVLVSEDARFHREFVACRAARRAREEVRRAQNAQRGTARAAEVEAVAAALPADEAELMRAFGASAKPEPAPYRAVRPVAVAPPTVTLRGGGRSHRAVPSNRP